MPVPPQLTQLVDAPPDSDSDQWLHEIKFDGYRMHRGDVPLLARAGLDLDA
jgi:bifunctional non-homologous end joining protein LigD